jgi:hypothetical protein
MLIPNDLFHGNPDGAAPSGLAIEDAHSVIRHLHEVIGELGFDTFFGAMQAEGGLSWDSAFVGSAHPINLIPSESRGPCRPVLVAVAKGTGRGATGLQETLKKIRLHLLRCGPSSNCGTPTEIVILISDEWVKASVAHSLEDLRFHAENGVTFVRFHAENGLSHVHWTL